MRSQTLIAVLPRLTIALAVAAPIVVFGFLHVLAVGPRRVSALQAGQRLEAARAELNRQRSMERPQPATAMASALDEFAALTSEGDSAGEMADAIAAILNGPAVGGVSNLSIETGAAADGPMDSQVALFPGPLTHTPITVTFNARYEQVGRFFWNLRTMPTTFDIRSVEMTPGDGGRAPLTRVRVGILAFHRPSRETLRTRDAAPQVVDPVTVPEWKRDPFAGPRRSEVRLARPAAADTRPESVVTSILYSTGRKVALVDGRVVEVGDTVAAGAVQAIEPEAVVIETSEGRTLRLQLERPIVHMARR